MGVLAGLFAALSLIALVGWSAVAITGGLARPRGAASNLPRRSPARLLLTVALVLAGASLVVLAAASFADHL